MRWRKVRRVKVTQLFRVISAAGLHQHTHMAKTQAMNRKAFRLQVNGRFRRTPTGLNRVSRDLWELGPPLLIHLQREVGQRSQVETFRIIGATRQQASHQGLGAGGKIGVAEPVSIRLHPAQHIEQAGRGIEANPIGQASVANRVVRHHDSHSAV